MNLILSDQMVELEKELEPLFQELLKSDKQVPLNEFEEKCTYFFYHNYLFLKNYLGCVSKFEPFSQAEFAEFLSVSMTSLRKWKSGVYLPNRGYLKSLLLRANDILRLKEPITVAHLLCKNLVNLVLVKQAKDHLKSFVEIEQVKAPIIPSDVGVLINKLKDFFVEAENKLDLLIDNISIGVTVFQKNKLIFVNKYFSEFTGYSIDELLLEDSPIELLISSKDITNVRTELFAINNNEKQEADIKIDFLTKSNETKKVEIRLKSAVIHGDKVTVATFLDYTENSLIAMIEDESKSIVATTLNNKVDVILFSDTNYIITKASDSAEDILGTVKENIIGKSILSLIEEQDVSAFENYMYKLNSSPTKVTPVEVKMRGYGDIVKHIEICATYYGDENGEAAIAYHFRDISDKIALENEIVKINDKYLKIFQALPDIYIQVDKNGNTIDYKGNIDTPYFKFEKIGSQISDIFPNEAAVVLQRALQDTIYDGQSASIEFSFLWDNVKHWFEARIEPLMKGHAIIIAREITDRKDAEAKIKSLLKGAEDSSSLLQTIIDATPDWIVVKDRGYRYMMANKAFTDDFNLSKDDVIAKDEYELGVKKEFIEGDSQNNIIGIRETDKKALEGKEVRANKEYFNLPNGNQKFVDTVKTPLYDNDGGVIAIIAYSREIK